MRALKRPSKVKSESRSSSTSSTRSAPIPKPKKLQKALNSLSAFLNRFDQVDHTIFETVTNLNSFICDILASTQKHPSRVDYTEFLNTWTKIKTQLSNNIITLNNTQISTLIDEELGKFLNIINQVDQNPPNNQKQQRDSKNVVRVINNVVNSARISSNKKQFDKLKIQMQGLRSDLSHQYEPFFKNSQINKEWKETIIDDSRRSLEKIISFCDIGKELGLTQFPFVDEISILLNELSNEYEIKKDNAKSLIPRHSPLKYERRSTELQQSDEKTPMKALQPNIKRVPYSARSKSEQSSSKISRIPKPKEQTTPDRSLKSKKVRSSLANPIDKEQNFSEQNSETDSSTNDKKSKAVMSARISRNTNAKANSKSNSNPENPNNNKPKPALSRSQKPVRASSISNSSKFSTCYDLNSTNNTTKDENNVNDKTSKKKEMVPLQESPKIQRKENPKNKFSSSQQVTFKKVKMNSEEEESSNSGQNERKYFNLSSIQNNKIGENDDLIENAISNLSLFEKRFVKYIATVGANDSLGYFVNELRATQNSIQNNQKALPQHISKLKNSMDQIEEQIDISKPLFEIEQNLEQALDQISDISNSMTSSVASNAELAEANSISKQFEIIKEQLEKVANDRRNNAESMLTNRIEVEFEKFQNAESTFKNAQENNETLKRLRKENIEMRKELQSHNSNKSKKSENSHKIENYKKIIIEMKAVNQRLSEIQIERKENPEDTNEIDAETEALLEQQNGLIEQLNNFDF
ncbi:hypothetical protein M9Y10_025729 [Tritrichomonas musculus]|uniref:Uncharacterized protein n=1 Tax=Tritrichomonas musculus TaxID=1915356 RepID=A0ABR2H9H3_9EUKA